MASEPSFWYRIGYALEQARLGLRAESPELSGLAERKPRTREARARADERPTVPVDDLVAVGVSVAVGRLLDAWHPDRKAGLGGLLRGGAAGAGAALLIDLVKPLLRGDEAGLPALDRETADHLIAGMAQGILYASVVEPRVPGPTLLKGALFGSAEYLADPSGGLAHLLGPVAPQARLPVLGALIEDLEPHDREYVEHVLFGIALAVLYGSSRSSSGTRDEGA